MEFPVTADGNNHVFHVYALLTDRRDALQKHLADHGVPTLIYYPQPLHLQKLYETHGWKRGDYPVSETTSERILPLPMYPELKDEHVAHVVATIRGFFS